MTPPSYILIMVIIASCDLKRDNRIFTTERPSP